ERVNIPARVVGVLVGIETDTLHLLQIDRHIQIGLIYRIRSGRSLQDSPFFEVNMDWMDPIARKDVVPQGPFLHCAFQDYVVYPVRVERQTIDMELPAIEREAPLEGRVRRRWWEYSSRQIDQRVRNWRRVGNDGVRHDVEPHDDVS